MTLRLHDTATRSVREFVPLQRGQASIYVCGATVQGPPHIGHVRSAVCFDILSRWMEHTGYSVTFVRNVTDIDDKILAKAGEAGVPAWQWAYRWERAFDAAYDLLGVRPVSYSPRATGHMPEMISLVERLIAAGHAYPAGGDVYFDVASWSDYGALSGQSPDSMQPAADSDSQGKRDPRDFALWKAAKPGEPAWESPWGAGRPGWHLECSAMATRYCGPEFDIHGGGLDLIFPHHENEIAQSRAAGDGFARYWLHNAWVTTAGEKMSKSLGNSLLVTELVKQVRPIELRYYLGAAHYRSMLEFSPEALQEAATGLRRIESFCQRASEQVGQAVNSGSPGVAEAFANAMDDDLGTPAALAVLHQEVTAGNTLLSGGAPADAIAESLARVRAMAAILGVDPLAEQWRSDGSNARLGEALSVIVQHLLDERASARSERNFARADSLRDLLGAAGVEIEDTPAGPRWTLGGE